MGKEELEKALKKVKMCNDAGKEAGLSPSDSSENSRLMALFYLAEVIEAKSGKILSELVSIEHNTDGPAGWMR